MKNVSGYFWAALGICGFLASFYLVLRPVPRTPAQFASTAKTYCNIKNGKLLGFSVRSTSDGFSSIGGLSSVEEITLEDVAIEGGEMQFLVGQFAEPTGTSYGYASNGAWVSYNSYSESVSYSSYEPDIHVDNSFGKARLIGGGQFEIELAPGEVLGRFRTAPLAVRNVNVFDGRWVTAEEDPELTPYILGIVELAKTLKLECLAGSP